MRQWSKNVYLHSLHTTIGFKTIIGLTGRCSYNMRYCLCLYHEWIIHISWRRSPNIWILNEYIYNKTRLSMCIQRVIVWRAICVKLNITIIREVRSGCENRQLQLESHPHYWNMTQTARILEVNVLWGVARFYLSNVELLGNTMTLSSCLHF